MSYRASQNALLSGTLLLLIASIFSPFLERTVRTNLEQISTPNVAAATIVRVWVFKKTGLYYCPDSRFYGQFKPGSYMTQEEALQRGYRPAGQEPCR